MASPRTIIALLSYAVVLCGILPLFPWLAQLPQLILGAALAASVWQDLRGAWPLKERLLNFSILLFFLFYALQINRSNLVDPVVSLLAIMLAVRLLGSKNSRHYLQIHALSLFCLASSSLYDLSLTFLAYLGVLLCLVAVVLVLLTFYDQDDRLRLTRSELRKVLAAGLMMPLFSLPMLLLFFYMLPRTPFPLWDYLNTAAARTSGLSEKVEPGLATATGESGALAFRAEMPRQAGQVYWRGKVFNRAKGQRWERDADIPAERIIYRGQRVRQTIYPEPALSTVLIAADAPAVMTVPRGKRNPDGSYELTWPGRKRLAYQADSAVEGLLPVERGIRRDFYLQLPDSLPEKLSRLAADLGRGSASDRLKLERLEQFFRNGGYRYTTSNLPVGERAVESFLFEERQGNCEFFASAHALLLRASGIPARLVGGYLGGEYNELGGYYLVSEKMAHVWVEAYLEGKGWLRVDPSAFAENAGAVWSRNPSPGLLVRLRMLIDSIDHVWNRSVIAYDFAGQLEFARRISSGMRGLDMPGLRRQYGESLFLMAGLLLAAVALITFRRRIFRNGQERLLNRFCRAVRSECGVAADPLRMGLFEIAEASGSDAAREFVRIYAGAVFRDRPLSRDEVRRLKRLLKAGFCKGGGRGTA